MKSPSTKTSFQAYLGWMLLFTSVLFFGAWLWALKAPLHYHDPDYSVWRAKVALLQRPNTRLMILGDSCAEDDLLPTRMGPGVINLGSAGTTPIDAYFVAKRIVAGSSFPRLVVISFAPFHFVNPTPDLFWARSTFDTFSASELDQIRSTSRQLHDNSLFGGRSPGDIDARLKIALLSLKFPSYDGPAIMKTIIASRYHDNLAAYQATLASVGQHYRDAVRENDRLDDTTALKDFVPSNLIDHYFDRMLALFQAKGIPVYFLGMPHRDLSDQYYTPALRTGYAQYLKSYANRYPNFQILDDPLPCYPMKYFGDYAHLNETGALFWTDHTVGLLNDAHVPGGSFGISNSRLTGSK